MLPVRYDLIDLCYVTVHRRWNERGSKIVMKNASASWGRKVIQNRLPNWIDYRFTRSRVGIEIKPITRNRGCAFIWCDGRIIDRHRAAEESQHIRIGEQL